MGNPSENKWKKHLCVGLLAHVDAGKTTLAESILYKSGSIRKLGRVDHQDAFLDTFEMERARGITIFSKQAELVLGDMEISLLDTPGHVDFSAEMERTLQILDYAVLVISGADGVQGHDFTLWRLLKRYQIPVFLFVNKMDQPDTERGKLMEELQKRLDDRCVDFTEVGEAHSFYENLAMCEEKVLEAYLETGEVAHADIRRLIRQRKVFPCYFGSALKTDGVEEFLDGLAEYMVCPDYPEHFAARVYKIARDAQGNRLTYMKITGGTLKVKMEVCEGKEKGEAEKADQIRIYSGAGFQSVKEAGAGSVCAVMGPRSTFAGQGLGTEREDWLPVLEPVLTYRLDFGDETDIHGIYLKLLQLEEEEPLLHVIWEEQSQTIHIQVMGEVQIEILKGMMKERFGLRAEFGAGAIVYKETIAGTVEGVGHFEPLRHYAEVHLLLEPGDPGSGLQFDTACSEDVLDRNWQRLILTHLLEKQHRGVLTGSEITDMKITLMSGRAHQKHTEGGDFRQATYRAVRQGLRSAKSVLLEPVYQFQLEVPSECVGRAMADITQMHGEFVPPVVQGDFSVLTGSVPVAAMRDYQMQVAAYTRGMGKLNCVLKGYEPCHNAQEVIEAAGYDPEGDLENPTGSVFCAHGAGFVVEWDKVPEYMHLESVLPREKEPEAGELTVPVRTRSVSEPGGWQGDRELEEIFNRTYGSGKEGRSGWGRSRFESSYRKDFPDAQRAGRTKEAQATEEYLLVDGYNIIFAWDDLKELAKVNIESARGKLMDILCNYQGYKKNRLILVFDAYKVEGGVGEVIKYHNIHVIYTKEAETADQYIEKAVQQIARKYHVTVATSDALEQRIIWGAGATRMSAEGLRREIEEMNTEIRSNWIGTQRAAGAKLFDRVSEEMAEHLEDVRLGKKEF